MQDNRADYSLSEFPGEISENPGWTIRHVKAAHPLMMVAVGSRSFMVLTHFFQDRTRPHRKHDCPACKNDLAPRWAGFLLGVDVKNAEQIILQYTPRAAIALKEATETYGSLRGLSLIISRTRPRDNAPMQIDVRGVNKNAHKLPPEPDIWPILCKLWQLNSGMDSVTDRPSTEGAGEHDTGELASRVEHQGVDDEWMTARLMEHDRREISSPSSAKDSENHRPKNLVP